MSSREVEQAAALVARARELCAARGRWSRRALARDRYRHPVRVESPSAVRFCALGALCRAAFESQLLDADRLAEWEVVMPVPLELAVGCVGEVFGWMLGVWHIQVEQVDGAPVLQVAGKPETTRTDLGWPEVIVLGNDARGMTAEAVAKALTAAEQQLRARRPAWLVDPPTPPAGQGP